MLRIYSFLMQTDVCYTFIILLGDTGLITQITLLEGSAVKCVKLSGHDLL